MPPKRPAKGKPPKEPQKKKQKASVARSALGNFTYEFPGKWDDRVQKKKNNRHCLEIDNIGAANKLEKPMPPVHPKFDGMVPCLLYTSPSPRA